MKIKTKHRKTTIKPRITPRKVHPELIMAMALVLVCLTLTVFLQTRGFEFCNYDDDLYVYKNPWVQSGLTARGIAWAFTDIHASNWHPLTWLSHMADCQLYGMNAGNHHLTNVLLHVLNTLLLFAAFCRMTGMRWQSFFLAAVFALHPLHVESVAWIAERKDVLSTFFMLLALNAYARYVADPSRARYLPVLGCFVCSLLSKPMLVTFPVLLLLLDYWPLNRLGSETAGQKTAPALLLEKAPLFACAALSTAISYVAQLKGGAVASLTDAPLQLRVANALVSYCAYLRDMVAPLGLAVFYPFPDAIPVAATACTGAALVAITLLVLRQRSRQPWLAVGWLWYIVALAPVIGIIKIGLQARADRYSYVPLVGIGIAAIWTIAHLLRNSRRSLALGILGGAAAVCALTAMSYQQARCWRNSTALFEHTLSVTHNNFIAHSNLASALIQENRLAEAITQSRLSLEINPRCKESYINLGMAFAQQGDWLQAVQSYRVALELDPDSSIAHNNMGSALLALNKPAEARDQFLVALQINPDYAEAHNNLGNAFAQVQDFDQALAHYQQAVRLLPGDSYIHCNLGNVYALKGMLPEAIYSFSTALQLNPASENARRKLEITRQLQNTL